MSRSETTHRGDEESSDAAGRLFAELIERERRGEPADPHELAAAHPELAPEMLEGLAMLSEIDAAVADSAAGRSIGDFRIVAEVGRGGMGVVYEAEQVSLGRRVALKILPAASMLDDKQVRRFQNEARAAAQLDHPNIVPVHAVGHDAGVHYYAMRFVEGESLREVLARVRRDAAAARADDTPSTPSTWPRTVAAWLAQAARALEHSHQLGILHRDIKPANLLLEADGHLSITDFGLAHSLLREHGGLTLSGEMLGTLAYCSPEQASGRHGLVDQRADVYSLGVTLYELSTLRPPHAGDDRAALLHKITHEVPRAPRRIDPRIPVDLETITLRAIALEPQHRYASAGELAADLEAFVAGRPIAARRTGAAERAWRWCRRNPGLAATAAAAALLALVAIAIGIALHAAVVQRDRARRAEAEVRVVQGIASARALLAGLDPGRRARALGHVATAVAALRSAGMSAAQRRGHELALRGVAIAALSSTALTVAAAPLADGQVGSIADPTFTRIARTNADDSLTVERADGTGTPWRALASMPAGSRLRFSPDGRWLAVREPGGEVRVLDVEDERRAVVLAPRQPIAGLDFLPDASGLVLIDRQGELYECPPRGGVARRTGRALGAGGEPTAHARLLRVAPGGDRLALVTHADAVQIHDRTGQLRTALDGASGIITCAWHPRGLLATGANDGSVGLWDVDAGRALASVEAHSGWAVEVAFDAVRPLLMSRSWDNTTRLWHAEDLTPIATVRGGGNDWATLGGGKLGPLRHRDVGRDVERTFSITASAIHRSYHQRVAPPTDTPYVTTDRRDAVLAATTRTGVALFARADGRLLRHVAVAEHPTSMAFDTAGEHLFVAAIDGCWRLDLRRAGDAVDVVGVTRIFSAGGRCALVRLSGGDLLVATERGGMHRIDASTLASRPLESADAILTSLTLSPDERWAAIDSWYHTGTVVWEVATGRVAWRSALVQCRSGFDARNRLWIADRGGITIHAPESWQAVARRAAVEADAPASMAFAPGGDLAAVTRARTHIQLLRTTDLAVLAEIEARPPCRPEQLEITPDGRWLLAGSQRRVAHAWDLEALRQELDALGLDW